VSLLAQVFDKMQLLRIQTTKNNPKLEIRTEHRQIYKPVREKTEAAVQAIKEHLIASKESNPKCSSFSILLKLL